MNIHYSAQLLLFKTSSRLEIKPKCYMVLVALVACRIIVIIKFFTHAYTEAIATMRLRLEESGIFSFLRLLCMLSRKAPIEPQNAGGAVAGN